MQPELQSKIIQGIEQYCVPEQVIDRLNLSISIATIYRALRDGLLPKILIPKLRRQGRRTYANNERRGKLSATTSIERRLEIVAKRERLGDWEGDTVAGTRGSGHFLTLVDRELHHCSWVPVRWRPSLDNSGSHDCHLTQVALSYYYA